MLDLDLVNWQGDDMRLMKKKRSRKTIIHIGNKKPKHLANDIIHYCYTPRLLNNVGTDMSEKPPPTRFGMRDYRSRDDIHE